MDSDDKKLRDIYAARLKDIKQRKNKYYKKKEAIPDSIEMVLQKVLGKNPGAFKKMDESRALNAWAGIVGDTVARVSRAIKISNDVLTVKVSEPIWLQQLIFLKRDLLKKYKKVLPRLVLKDIFFMRG